MVILFVLSVSVKLNTDHDMQRCPLDNVHFKEDQISLDAFPLNFLIKDIIEAAGAKTNFCHTHERKHELICLKDKCKVCSHCAIFGDHQGHKMKCLKELNQEMQKDRGVIDDSLTKLGEYKGSISKLLEEKRQSFHKVVKNQFEETRRSLYSREFEVINEIDAIFAKEVQRLDLTIGEPSSLFQRLRKKANNRKDIFNNEDFLQTLEEDVTSYINEVTAKLSKERVEKVQRELDEIEKSMIQQSVDHRRAIHEMKFLPHSLYAENTLIIPLEDFTNSQEDTDLINKSLCDKAGLNSYSVGLKLCELSKQITVSLPSEKDENTFNFGPKEWMSVSSVKFVIKTPSLDHKEELALNYLWHQAKKIRTIDISFQSKNVSKLDMYKFINVVLQNTSHLENLAIDFGQCEANNLCIASSFRQNLQRVQGLQSLSLILDSTKISNRSLMHLSMDILPFMKRLKILRIDLYGANNFTGKGLLTVLKSCLNVERLNLHLQDTRITNNAIEEFSANTLPRMKNLIDLELHLVDLPIYDQTVVQLLTNLPNLQRLSLHLNRTKVTDKSMEYFIEELIPRQASLTSFKIGLEGTEVSSKVLKRIEELQYALESKGKA